MTMRTYTPLKQLNVMTPDDERLYVSVRPSFVIGNRQFLAMTIERDVHGKPVYLTEFVMDSEEAEEVGRALIGEEARS